MGSLGSRNSGAIPADRPPPRIRNVRLKPPSSRSPQPATRTTSTPAPQTSTNPTILLAEDNEDDVVAIRHALTRGNVPYTLNVVRDGEQAIQYIKGSGAFSDRREHPYPVLLLLDLRMPKRDGFAVLEWLSQSSNLSRLIVVVLTGSESKSDMDRAFNLGANSYLLKTPAYDDLINFLKSFDLSR
jgi:CheY-like chemotaxis protein